MDRLKATLSTISAGCFTRTLKRRERRWRSTCDSHKVIAGWKVHDDLQGLTLDSARGFLFVACGDHVVSLDVAHGGRLIDSLVTGPGLDNIDFSSDQKLLYAAASVTATLSIIEVSDDGKFHLKALVPTVKGARGVVAGKGETAYLIGPAEGRILKMTHK